MHQLLTKLAVISVLALGALGLPALAQDAAGSRASSAASASNPKVSLIYGATDGVAIEGYETVAYFVDGQATWGDPAFKAEYGGTTWYFKDQKHLNLFKANPAQYVPQFGGYCAYAASQDSIASSNPKRWRVVDNKLYLNNNCLIRKVWQSNVPSNIDSGERNWTALSSRIEKRQLDKLSAKKHGSYLYRHLVALTPVSQFPL